MLPSAEAFTYGQARLCSDTKLNIPSQCMQLKHARRPNKQYCANLCLKINLKLVVPTCPLVSNLDSLLLVLPWSWVLMLPILVLVKWISRLLLPLSLLMTLRWPVTWCCCPCPRNPSRNHSRFGIHDPRTLGILEAANRRLP